MVTVGARLPWRSWVGFACGGAIQRDNALLELGKEFGRHFLHLGVETGHFDLSSSKHRGSTALESQVGDIAEY